MGNERLDINEEVILQESINFTDPFILHDPSIEQPNIAQLYMPSDHENNVEDENDSNDKTEILGTNKEFDSTKTFGKLFPLVQVNTRVIVFSQIRKLTIFYDSFLPTINLTIVDYDHITQALDMPGLNNSIKVVMLPMVDNKYKSIKLEFNITDCQIKGDTVSYTGVYKLVAFNKEYTKELIYTGCTNKDCNSLSNKQPNTWEYLHTIALACGLGFQSTDKCKEIQDRLPRLMQNQKFPEFIEKHIAFSGIDEDSIFDCWVDLYGYLTLVNVAWELTNTEVSPNNLAIYAEIGLHGTDAINTTSKHVEQVHRTITNYNTLVAHNNMVIEYYETIVDNSDLYLGTSMSIYNLGLSDIGGNNSISQYDVEVIQNSIDGQKTEEYASQKQRSLVIECNDLPINRQKLIREKFFTKHRQRILKVLLREPNFGFQRGTLINVILFEDNPKTKKILLDSTSNLDSENDSPIPDNTIQELSNMDQEQVIEEGSVLVPNLALTGMYYIDSMRFEYVYETNKINQYLYLIKRGNTSNINNLHTSPKLNA